MMPSRVSVVITRLLMTCTRSSAYEVTVERTSSCGISCCSMRIVPAERKCGGSSTASSTRPQQAQRKGGDQPRGATAGGQIGQAAGGFSGASVH